MKKYVLLTSMLALAACGGGSGGGVGTPAMSGMSAVAKSNRNVTVLPTKVDNRSEIVAYVESQLGSDYYDYDTNSSGSATTRAGSARAGTRTLTLAEKYEQARKKLKEMNEVLAQMKLASDVSDFITENMSRVMDALKLAGIKIDDTAEGKVEEIKTAFNGVNDALLDEVNKKTKLKEQSIEEITFNRVVFDDIEAIGYADGFELKLDDDGKIASALFVGGEDDDDDFMLKRVGDSKIFKTDTVYSYEFNGEDGIEVEVESLEKLSLANMKAQLRAAVEKEYDDHPKKAKALATIDAFTEKNQVFDREDHTGFLAAEKVMSVDIQTRGKDLGMQYADFGFLRGNVRTVIGNMSDQEGYIEAFAGGYSDKEIVPKDMSGKMVFNGQAVGGVSYVLDTRDENGEEKSVSGSKFLEDKKASLTFDKDEGTETLKMNFANNGWYNVTVTSKDGKSDIKFDGNVSDKNYAFINTDVKDFASGLKNGSDDSAEWNSNGKYQTGYYGDNGNPHDATAIVGFVEESHTNDSDNQWDHQIGFGAAFGGVKQ